MQNTAPLLPLTQIFTKAYLLFKFRADTLFVLLGSVQIIVALFAWLTGGLAEGNPFSLASSMLAFLSVFLGVFVIILVVLLLKATLAKEELCWQTLFADARRKFWPLVGAGAVLLAALGLVLLLALLGLLVIYLLFTHPALITFCTVLWAILLILALAAGLTFLLFYHYAILVDDVPALQSFRHSISLVKGHFWTVFLFYLCLLLCFLGVSLAAGVTRLLILPLFMFMPTLGSFLVWLISTLFSVMAAAYVQCANMVLYMNLSKRIPAQPAPAAEPADDL